MTVESELNALRDADPGNMLYPERIVEWAEAHPTSDLYQKFEWNDGVAAKKYRLWQCRQLVKVHIIDVRGDPVMISLQVDRKAGGGYRTIVDVIAQPDLKEMALVEALAALRVMQRRYQQLHELDAVWSAVDTAAAAVKKNPKPRTGETDQPRGFGV
jgi:hypothetical protein